MKEKQEKQLLAAVEAIRKAVADIDKTSKDMGKLMKAAMTGTIVAEKPETVRVCYDGVNNTFEKIPKFKVGDWVRHLPFDQVFKVVKIERGILYKSTGCNAFGYYPEACEKWIPKKGDYVVNGDGIMIFDYSVVNYYFFCQLSNDFLWIARQGLIIFSAVFDIRPATPAEIALLDSKLAEQGKRFDRERGEIVEIEKRNCRTCFNGNTHIQNRDYCIGCTPTYKEGAIYNNWQPITQPKPPIIGELAIFWDRNKCEAIIANLGKIDTDRTEYRYVRKNGVRYMNAILFESTEQYKNFIK